MKRLIDSATWRLLFWLILFGLILIGAFAYLVQTEVRQSLINDQMEIMREHAKQYAIRLQANAGAETRAAIEMSEITRGEQFYLIASNGAYLAHSNPLKVGQSASQDFGFETIQVMLSETTTTIYDTQSGQIIGTYRATLRDPLAVASAPIADKVAAINALPNTILAQVLGAFLVTALGFWAAVTYNVGMPLAKLKAAANQLAAGAWNAEETSTGLHGDVADIFRSFEQIAETMKHTRASGADELAEERLQMFERRSALLKAVADVGKAITSFRSVDELLEKTVYLINENFGFYHAGIFLLDEHKEYAVLKAANSEGGKTMLARKHQLKVGGASIVGYVTQNLKARIALDVGKDAVYFDNPDLPQTRSEMALPLVVGGQALGALDVQSTESRAFAEDDIATLQILAEQIAVALQNANLLNETEKALDAARAIYGDMSREAWNKILRNQQQIDFLATEPGVVSVPPEAADLSLVKALESGDVLIGSDNLSISVPIKIRGQAIGAIRLKKSEISEAWSPDETNLAIALADQLSGALESARLYKESQQRAAREALVSDIAARISAISRTEAILRETVQELGQTVGNAAVTFQLLEEFSPQKPSSLSEHELPHEAKL
ncbi:MAG: hypothetical protein Fur002_08910 [Anaerolineales bacterium]